MSVSVVLVVVVGEAVVGFSVLVVIFSSTPFRSMILRQVCGTSRFR